MAFTGFTRESVDFLRELKFNNEFSQKDALKDRYKRLLTEPLISLYEALVPAVGAISTDLDTKRVRCVSTPYTDRRFSPTAPFKEYVYLRFRLFDRDENILGFFFDMGDQSYDYGLCRYDQTTAGMAALREGIVGAADDFNEVLTPVMQNGFTPVSEKYKRDHYPLIGDCPAKELLNRRYFCVCRSGKTEDGRPFDKDFSDEIAEGFFSLGGLFELVRRY